MTNWESGRSDRIKSLARSVAASAKSHQMLGKGLPPKVIRRAMYSLSSQVMTMRVAM